ncbi:phage tail protein [Streptomyces sp. CC53]|uniref:spherulation-specific family 4 protein n=1 Tax=unclassified Streptomyces TaxID=2593676 RepID=UPI0008DD2BAA|nr:MULTISPECIES: spherulation-specific family 4 protein [unclassified Streptomyces]OII66150.1 phage tail protein [Streptomyces sp. CC53]
MPHLTTVGTDLSATGAERLGIGIPGYAHPLLAPVEWAELTRPGTPLHWAVLNVSDGPGTRPDPHCLEVAGRLRNAGVRVLGHLALRDGDRRERPFGDVVSDAHRYADWYRVSGYLLDSCPTERSALPEVRRLAATLETVLDDADGCHLVLSHGTHPDPGYAEIGDQLVTYCGPWTEYRWSQAEQWTADHPPERFVHLVHGVPRSHLEEAVRIARWQGAGTIFFTDRGQNAPFTALPGYWDEIVSQIGPGVSE